MVLPELSTYMKRSSPFDIDSIEELFEDTVPGMQKMLLRLLAENQLLKEHLTEPTDTQVDKLKNECHRLRAMNTEMGERCKMWRDVAQSKTGPSASQYIQQLAKKEEEIVRLKRKVKEVVESCQKWRTKFNTSHTSDVAEF